MKAQKTRTSLWVEVNAQQDYHGILFPEEVKP